MLYGRIGVTLDIILHWEEGGGLELSEIGTKNSKVDSPKGPLGILDS